MGKVLTAVGWISVMETGSASISSISHSASVNPLTACFDAAYMPIKGATDSDIAAQVDERPAATLKMGQSRKRAIHDAPEVDVEQAPAVGFAYFIEAPINGNAGVVYPCIDPAEATHGLLGCLFHFLPVRDIRRYMQCLSPVRDDPSCQRLECFRAPCNEDQPGPLAGRVRPSSVQSRWRPR